MMNWKYRIDVSEPWQVSDVQGIVDILKGFPDIPEYLVADIEATVDLDDGFVEFDDAWDSFYDWADSAQVWVETR